MTDKGKAKKFQGFNKGKGVDGPVAQFFIGLIMACTVFIVMMPIFITILSSLKTNYEAALGVWSWPMTPKWENWNTGFHNITGNMVNSLIICIVSTAGVVFLSSIVAYVLVRHNFPGKELVFYGIIALMIIPGVLTLTPSFLLMMNLGIKNTWWALILPYISGGQVGAIFLFRTFMSQQPKDLFEAAKIDGAGELTMYARIAIPLAVPVLAIQAVGTFGAYYNDYLWPMLVIDEQSKQTLMPVLRSLTAQISGIYEEQGITHAMYLMSGIPLIFTTAFGLKYFINGDFAAGLKL
ncbi:MAG TPA: carbohydrate ABC transporter permease [Clostridiales bacterium]|nr:carbohydrate ABC transporter permease [Clostridiales bacterium]